MKRLHESKRPSLTYIHVSDLICQFFHLFRLWFEQTNFLFQTKLFLISSQLIFFFQPTYFLFPANLFFISSQLIFYFQPTYFFFPANLFFFPANLFFFSSQLIFFFQPTYFFFPANLFLFPANLFFFPANLLFFSSQLIFISSQLIFWFPACLFIFSSQLTFSSSQLILFWHRSSFWSSARVLLPISSNFSPSRRQHTKSCPTARSLTKSRQLWECICQNKMKKSSKNGIWKIRQQVQLMQMTSIIIIHGDQTKFSFFW